MGVNKNLHIIIKPFGGVFCSNGMIKNFTMLEIRTTGHISGKTGNYWETGLFVSNGACKALAAGKMYYLGLTFLIVGSGSNSSNRQ